MKSSVNPLSYSIMAKKYQSSLGEQKIFQSSTFVQHEEVKKNILILPELESLIPPLGEEERAQLEANILAEGCREALLIWPTSEQAINTDASTSKQVYVLIDGHNRFAICKQHHLDFPIHFVKYNTLEEVKGFMIDNQLGRRNLTSEQASYLRGMKYLNTRQNKGKYERFEHKAQNELYAQNAPLNDSKDHKAQNELYAQTPSLNGPKDHKAQNELYGLSGKKVSTAEALAAEFNVGHATIKRDAEFAQGLEKLSPRLKTEVLGGKVKLGKGVVQQLAKAEHVIEPIDSIEAIATLLSPPPKEAQAPQKPEEKLIQQIASLVSKLKSPKKRPETCDKLIELLHTLKQES